jgi:hypothetical protein
MQQLVPAARADAARCSANLNFTGFAFDLWQDFPSFLSRFFNFSERTAAHATKTQCPWVLGPLREGSSRGIAQVWVSCSLGPADAVGASALRIAPAPLCLGSTATIATAVGTLGLINSGCSETAMTCAKAEAGEPVGRLFAKVVFPGYDPGHGEGRFSRQDKGA